MSRYADNCGALSNRTKLFNMDQWLDNPLKQFSDALASSVEGINQGWKASTDVFEKLRNAGADRWQAAIRQIQAPMNLADILRARNII